MLKYYVKCIIQEKDEFVIYTQIHYLQLGHNSPHQSVMVQLQQEFCEHMVEQDRQVCTEH